MILFSILFFSCSQKIKELNFYRDSTEKYETLQLNFKTHTFVYSAEIENEKFVASGTIEEVEKRKGLTLLFPEHSETKKLSPFKKGYVEIIKGDTSRQIEIELSVIDLKYGFSLFKNRSTLLSSVDSTEIETFDSALIQLESKHAGNVLRIKNEEFYYDEEFEVPNNGKYKVNVYLQQVETKVSYETTTEGCSPVSIKPKLYAHPCKIENDTIKVFGLYRDCRNSFLLKD